MDTRVAAKNYAVVMAVIVAILYPIVVRYVGGNHWGYALLFMPIAGVGTYVGCRLGQRCFGSSRRG